MVTNTNTNPALHAQEQALIEQVRRHAAGLLPPGVVPARFVVLDSFPRLPNGKTDRARLPEPSTAPSPTSAKQTHCGPRTDLERIIADIWTEVLGHTTADIDIDTAFNDLGGSSLSMMQMAARVKAATGKPVDVRRFMAAPTIRNLAGHLGGASAVALPRQMHNADEDKMRADAALPADIIPLKPRSTETTICNILVTGGTGYTGAFLLRELLDRSHANIIVLARGRDAEDVAARALANMESYNLPASADDAARLIGVVGDTSSPYLGMTPPDYERVARDCDIIIHNAADSRWTISYDEAKLTNVLGAIEVLRLAQSGGNTPLHYIGSTGSFPTRDGSPVWDEDVVEDLDGVLGGYRQTKWVSDQLMHQARDRGMRVSVYRPGALVGAQDTGACSTDTFINHLIRGWIHLGAAMRYDLQVELVPIDYCARAIAYLALQQAEPATYHVLGTHAVMMNEFLDHLIAYGYDLETLNYPEWYERLLAAAEAGDENDLVPYLPLFGPEAPGLEIGMAGNHPQFNTARLNAALRGSGIEQQAFDQSMMFTYLDYFVEIGFLPAPTRTSGPNRENEVSR